MYLKHDDLVNLNVGTVAGVNYKTISGNTLFERYESIHCKVTELTNIIIAKGGSGYFWVVMSEPMYQHFTHKVIPSKQEIYPQGTKDIQHMGILNRKWDIYIDPLIETNKMIIGCRNHPDEPKYFGSLTLLNMMDEEYINL